MNYLTFNGKHIVTEQKQYTTDVQSFDTKEQAELYVLSKIQNIGAALAKGVTVTA